MVFNKELSTKKALMLCKTVLTINQETIESICKEDFEPWLERDSTEFDFSWVFTQQSPLVIALREAYTFRNQLTIESIKDKVIISKMKKLDNILTSNFEKTKIPSLIDEYADMIFRNSPRNGAYDTYEILINAIEHGSNFCIEGNVTVNLKAYKEGLTIITNQPLQADIHPTYISQTKNLMERYINRGNGFNSLIETIYEVGFENTSSGMNQILLYKKKYKYYATNLISMCNQDK